MVISYQCIVFESHAVVGYWLFSSSSYSSSFGVLCFFHRLCFKFLKDYSLYVYLLAEMPQVVEA